VFFLPGNDVTRFLFAEKEISFENQFCRFSITSFDVKFSFSFFNILWQQDLALRFSFTYPLFQL